MKALVHAVVNAVVEWVWPGPCLVCGGTLPGACRDPVCPACWAALPAIHARARTCARCDLPLEGRNSCPDCRLRRARGGWSLDCIRAAYVYREGVVEAHRELKFRGADALVAPFARRMALTWALRGPWEPGLVLPVPPDPLRLGPRARIAGRLARRVAILLRAPTINRPRQALTKRRPSRSQARGGREVRLDALEGAFRARRNRVQGLSVLVVDDIATTGSTLEACAAALLAAGARRVAGLVLARTP